MVFNIPREQLADRVNDLRLLEKECEKHAKVYKEEADFYALYLHALSEGNKPIELFESAEEMLIEALRKEADGYDLITVKEEIINASMKLDEIETSSNSSVIRTFPLTKYERDGLDVGNASLRYSF